MWKTKQFLVLSDFYCIILIILNSMWTSNCLVTQILQNIFFCVQHKKVNTGLGQHVSQ